MVSLRVQFFNVFKIAWVGAFLKFLTFFAFCFPSCGNYTKRLFFILTVYLELQRIKITDTLALSKINDKVLKIKQPVVLTNALAIAQSGLTHLDFDQLVMDGASIRELLQKSSLSAPEAEMIGQLLAKQSPSGLQYGTRAMSSDVARLLDQIKPPTEV